MEIALLILIVVLLAALLLRKPPAADLAPVNARLDALDRSVREEIARNRGETSEHSRALREELQNSLARLAAANEQKLEQVRRTVDEQLQGTLEKRLGESFRLVSERLEQVYKGL